ncbi:hypothetical protein AAC387_Pa03g3263 [Persea americana]
MSKRRALILTLLEKCKSMKQLKQAHAQMITSNLAQEPYALSRLMAHFSLDPTPSALAHSLLLFDHIQRPTICIYNTMIKALLLHNHFIHTLQIYGRMLVHGHRPDHYTLPSLFKACASLQDSQMGDRIHALSLKLGLASDIFVANALIQMSVCCGDLIGARKVFDEMPLRSEVSWTVLISGYAKRGEVEIARQLFDEAPVKDRGIWGAMISVYVQNNCFKEGLVMFRMMQLADLEADEAVLVSVLCACGQLGALDVGLWVHGYVERVGLRLGVRLGTALVDMYMKCGSLGLAKKVFDEMRDRDSVCWNVMIMGLGVHGDGEGAFELFEGMQKAGFRPDDVTFIAIFTACNHSGMVCEGLREFGRMWEVYGIEPKGEHFGCVVDFLGRAGLFEEAMGVIRRIPASTSPLEEAIAWRALLSACWNHGETQLAEVAADRLVQLERHSGVYVLMSNIYAADGKFIDARRIRNMMKDRGVEKTPGCSSIEVNGSVHEFIAGEKIHPQMEEIYGILVKMNAQLDFAAHKPDLSEILEAKQTEA